MEEQQEVVENTEQEVDTTEEDEWSQAADLLDEEEGTVRQDKDEKEDEPKDEEKSETKEEKQEAEEGTQEEAPKEDFSEIRNQRTMQRQMAEEERELRAEIAKELYGSDLDGKLYDADGDEIKGVEDVMALENPNTGTNFTQEEAAIWLMRAQQNQEREISEKYSRVDQITDVTLSLRDSADSLKEKYGELFEAMPELQKQLYDQFKNTLEVDPDTGVILKAPVSIEAFYNTALSGYVKMAERLEQESKEAAELKAKEDRKRSRRYEQSDRRDVLYSNDADIMDEEEKEWAAAAKEYY